MRFINLYEYLREYDAFSHADVLGVGDWRAAFVVPISVILIRNGKCSDDWSRCGRLYIPATGAVAHVWSRKH